MNLRSSSCGALLIFVAASWLPAQIQITAMRTPGGEVTLHFTQGNSRLSAIAGRPYSALDSLEETLATGTHVLIKSDPIYRDEMGRSRTERRQFLAETGTFFEYVEIVDPVNGLQYVLDPAHDIAYRIHVALSVHASAAPPPCPVGKPMSGSTAGNIATLNEGLGTKIIDGLAVCGQRTTLTYPAGSAIFGNDRPVSTVSEDWTSWEELGRIVSTSHSQPGTGVIDASLKNLRLEEPEPSLFRPPASYRIVDESAEFTVPLETAKRSKQQPRNVTALTGMPYSAEQVLSTEEVLGDGTS